MGTSGEKPEIEDKSKHWLSCPECWNAYLIPIRKSGKLKEIDKNFAKKYLVYSGKIYYSDPEFGYGHEPEPGPGLIGALVSGAFLCKCGYYSLDYKDFY